MSSARYLAYLRWETWCDHSNLLIQNCDNKNCDNIM